MVLVLSCLKLSFDVQGLLLVYAVLVDFLLALLS